MGAFCWFGDFCDHRYIFGFNIRKIVWADFENNYKTLILDPFFAAFPQNLENRSSFWHADYVHMLPMLTLKCMWEIKKLRRVKSETHGLVLAPFPRNHEKQKYFQHTVVTRCVHFWPLIACRKSGWCVNSGKFAQGVFGQFSDLHNPFSKNVENGKPFRHNVSHFCSLI